jgi:hypothetical protein
VSASTLGILGVALACPPMMFVTTRAMMGDQTGTHAQDEHPINQAREPSSAALLCPGACAGAFYTTVLATSGGSAHLLDQAGSDWWLVGPIVLASGARVALTEELRHRRRTRNVAAPRCPHRRLDGWGGGLVRARPRRLVPLLSVPLASPGSVRLADPVMAGPLAINLAAVTITGHRLSHLTHDTIGPVSWVARPTPSHRCRPEPIRHAALVAVTIHAAPPSTTPTGPA